MFTPKRDRKSTRLNSSHMSISYAVFCLKKKIDQAEPAAEDHEIARLEVPVAVNARQPIARRRQVGIEGSQHPLVVRSRGHFPIADDVMSVEVVQLEQKAVAVEGAGRGEIGRAECRLPLVVEKDDEIAGFPVEALGLAGTPPAPPRIKKMLSQGDVPEILRQDEPLERIGSEDAGNRGADRREHPVVAEQGSAGFQGLRMDDQDCCLLSPRDAIKPPGGGVSSDLRYP